MHLRIALLAATLVPVAGNVLAELPFCKLLHHRHAHRCCDDCQVHVHVCPPAEHARHHPQADLPQPVSQQLMYSQVLPSTVGYTMPMMSMMAPMPMMMPYPVQQAALGMQPQQQLQQQLQQPAHAPQSSVCGGCEERVQRLENGVKHLSERMDKIETILENQIIAMGRIHDVLKEKNLLQTPPAQ